MIRVDIEREVRPGVWQWRSDSVRHGPVDGRSRQPLLDACRAYERAGEDALTSVGLFWPGESDWALRCSVGWGAGKTVVEDADGLRMIAWKTFKRPRAWEGVV
jgi:hypothetical protein